MSKVCVECKKTEPEVTFYVCKSRKDGYSTYCKACNKTRSKARYQKDSAKYKQKSLQYYYENRDKCLARQKKWLQENKDYMTVYREKHEEEVKEKYQRQEHGNGL